MDYKEVPFTVKCTDANTPSDVSGTMLLDYGYSSGDLTGSSTDGYSVHIQENENTKVGSRVNDLLDKTPYLIAGLNNGQRRLIDLNQLSQTSFGSVVANVTKFEKDSFKTRDTNLNEVYNGFRIKYSAPYNGDSEFYCNIILKNDFSGVNIETNADLTKETDFDTYALLFAEEAQASGSFYGFSNVLDIEIKNWDFRQGDTNYKAVTRFAYDLLRITGWRRSEKQFTNTLEYYMANRYFLGDAISFSDFVHTSNITQYGLVSHLGINMDRVETNVITLYIDRPTPSVIDEQVGSATIFNEQDGSTRVITE